MDSDDIIRITWVALGVVLSAAEIVVPGFFLLPFGLGAGVAAIVAFLGGHFLLQMAAFVVASGVFFAALRPIARRLNEADDPPGVGANRLLRMRGIVLEQIGPLEAGVIRVDTEDWKAEAADGVTIPAGAQVTVVEVRGTRVIVTAVDQTAPLTGPPLAGPPMSGQPSAETDQEGPVQ